MNQLKMLDDDALPSARVAWLKLPDDARQRAIELFADLLLRTRSRTTSHREEDGDESREDPSDAPGT